MGLAIKALSATTSPVHAFEWSLPTQSESGEWIPGEWHAVKGRIKYRRNGLHLARPDQIEWWTKHLRGRKLTAYVVEYDGQTSVGVHGFAARRVRILRPWQGETL